MRTEREQVPNHASFLGHDKVYGSDSETWETSGGF
jgi:hypothetical protein